MTRICLGFDDIPPNANIQRNVSESLPSLDEIDAAIFYKPRRI